MKTKLINKVAAGALALTMTLTVPVVEEATGVKLTSVQAHAESVKTYTREDLARFEDAFRAFAANSSRGYLTVNYNPGNKEKRAVLCFQQTANFLARQSGSGTILSEDSVYGEKSAARCGELQAEFYLTRDKCAGPVTIQHMISAAEYYLDLAEQRDGTNVIAPESARLENGSAEVSVTITGGTNIKGLTAWAENGRASLISLKGTVKDPEIVVKARVDTNTTEGVYFVVRVFTSKGYYDTKVPVICNNRAVVLEALNRVQADVDAGFNGLNEYHDAWCAYYASRYVRDYCGIAISGAGTTGALAKQLVNSGNEMYLYSADHYNAVINNEYSGITFTQTGKSHVHFVSKDAVKPEPGDLILFKWSSSSSKREISHVGIVASYEQGNLLTYEGNSTFYGTRDAQYLGKGTRYYNSNDVIGIIKLNG